jgi:hypothetical protein
MALLLGGAGHSSHTWPTVIRFLSEHSGYALNFPGSAYPVLSQSGFFESLGVYKPLNSRHQIFGFCPKIELCDRISHEGAAFTPPHANSLAAICMGTIETGSRLSRRIFPKEHLSTDVHGMPRGVTRYELCLAV